MAEEDRVENHDQEGYLSLWEMLQGPVRDPVPDRSLATLTEVFRDFPQL
jgi:hypothetical protein